MRHVTTMLFVGALLVGQGQLAFGDDTADLIEQDKAWAAAGMKGDKGAIATFLADDLVSVDETGIRDKKGDLAAATAAPADAKYEPTDYKVTFLDTVTAVMTHGTKGQNAHNSLHIWSKKSGQWKVVATSSTPIASK